MTPSGLANLRAWFRLAARDYPWTTTEDPYAIWISEIMLQQTVVTAVVAPFSVWMLRWPSLAALAATAEDEVLRAWEGLGYPSRARNIHKTARLLVERGSLFPDSEGELLALPGIGSYTAAAILSFAHHRPVLTLDANLKRVFQRLEAQPTWTTAVETKWRGLWPDLVGGSSREANQAVMQLGQLICRAKKPQCASCPLKPECLACARGLTESIPPPKQRSVVEKQTSVVFWYRDERWWLARPTQGRFSTLWLAPPLTVSLGADYRLSGRVHTYTKYRDRLTPYTAPWTALEDPALPEGWMGRWVSADEARTLGMVSVYRRILEEALQPDFFFENEVAEP